MGLVSYLPKVGGSVASFIVSLTLFFFYSNAFEKKTMVSGIYFIFQ
jgi:hypothetical protein